MELNKLRQIGNSSTSRKWYKEFCSVYDEEGPGASARFLKKHPIFTKILPYIDYYEGKTGSAVKHIETFSLRYPMENNSCVVCDKLTKWGPEINNWRSTCSLRCAALDCEEARKVTNLKKYGVANAGQAKEVKDKRTATIRKRFGVDNAFQSKKIMRKAKTKIQERFGVENVSQAESIKEKKRATALANFGYTHWTKDPVQLAEKHRPFDAELLAKARATCMKRFGVDNPWKLESVQEQIRLKHFNTYGANPGAVFNGFKRRIVEDCFGIRHIVMGYEDLAIKYFSKQKSVVRIVSQTKKLPRFRYTGRDKKLHNYHPDLMVFTKTTAHVIEVKSEWTLALDIDKNIRKFKVATRSCIRKGYSFWVFVFHKGKVHKVKNPTCLQDLLDAGLPVRHQSQ